MFNKKKKNNKGFTLVELLVVIAIIGILAVVAVPSLFKQIDKAKSTQVIANVKALSTEVMTEYASASNDTQVKTTMTPAYIGTLLDLTLESGTYHGKLEETYAVENNDIEDEDAKDGKVNIVITFKDANMASNIAGQLGTNAKVKGAIDSDNKVVIYTVGK